MSSAISLSDLKTILLKLKASDKKVVFTNGVFDLIHAGHVDYLSKSKALGDILVVGLNSDDSVKRVKAFGDGGVTRVQRRDLAEIIEARTEEIY